MQINRMEHNGNLNVPYVDLSHLNVFLFEFCHFICLLNILNILIECSFHKNVTFSFEKIQGRKRGGKLLLRGLKKIFISESFIEIFFQNSGLSRNFIHKNYFG